jgi:hypothetical protein
MKTTIERLLFHFLLVACFPILFLFIGTSCKTETVDETPVKIIGTWHQTSRVQDGVTTTKDSTRLLIQINANNICVLCDSTTASVNAKTIVKRSGWSYTGGLFNLAVDLPASWTPVVTANDLSIERVDFNQTGTVTRTTLHFTRIANIDFQ